MDGIAPDWEDEFAEEWEGQDLWPDPDPVEEEKSKERLRAFVATLEQEANRRADARVTVEQRWMDDLRQYHGQYDDLTTSNLAAAKASKVFINLTRTKTDSLVARLWDLLFPTDDRNWGVSPTPVPELDESSEEFQSITEDAGDTLAEFSEQMEGADPAQAAQMQAEAQQMEEARTIAQEKADELHEIRQEAIRRCRLMQEEIEDQLVHSNYQAEARDAIEDACKIGVGVLKGPLLGERGRQKWEVQEDGTAVLVEEASEMPSVKRVDPWGFYPSIDARTPGESEGFYERHLLNPKQMRALSRRPDIDEDAVREIMLEGQQGKSDPSFLPELQSLTNQQTQQITKDLYHVWEYTGPIDADDLEVLANDLGADDAQALLEDEIDPLVEINLRIWFCQGRVLSVSMYPLDSEEPLYSVFTLARDEYSMFGFGMPSIIRDPQAMLNSATRMLMDNAGLSTGPQIVVNTDVVTPYDGDYTLRPRKVWKRKGGDVAPNASAFETYDIPGHQAELGGIIEMSKSMIDEMSGMPAVAQGEQGAATTKTAQGMALLMNSANVAFRRYVKNFDDDVTRPIIRRMYHFNMQFSDKPEIKGDYEVDARGSSVLLVREMQVTNLMMFAQAFGEHPTFGPRIKDGELLSAIMRALMIPADELLFSDREYRKRQEEMAKQKAENDPAVAAAKMQAENEQARNEIEMTKIQTDAEVRKAEWDSRLKIAELQLQEQRERTQASLAEKRESDDTNAAVKLETAKINAATKAAELDSSERKMAVEVGVKNQTGDSAGGAI